MVARDGEVGGCSWWDRSLSGGSDRVAPQGPDEAVGCARSGAAEAGGGAHGDPPTHDDVRAHAGGSGPAPPGPDSLAEELSTAADTLLDASDDDEPTELKENRFLSACRNLLEAADK